MNYEECLRSKQFDLGSWLIALLGPGISFIFLKYGKIAFAIASA